MVETAVIVVLLVALSISLLFLFLKKDVGLTRLTEGVLAKEKQLRGGPAKKNAVIAKRILTGRDKSSRRDISILNAAAILYAAGKAKSLEQGIKLAADSIDSGRAWMSLKKLVQISHDTE